MLSIFRHRFILLLGLLAGAVGVAFAVYSSAHTRAISFVAAQGATDLSQAAARLDSQLQSFGDIAVLLARDPRLSDPGADQETLRDVLLTTTDLTGALDIILLDRMTVIANAVETTPREGLPQEDLVTRAFQGALGRDHAISARFGRRAYYFTAPVFSVSGPVTRAVVVIVDLEQIEADWRGTVPAVFFTDQHGVVFVSNRSELLLTSKQSVPEPARGRYGTDPLKPFVRYYESPRAGQSIWRIDGGRYLPTSAIHLTQPLLTTGFSAHAVVDTAPADRLASLQAAVATAVWLVFSAIVLLLTERRRALARANAGLESRVAARTSELSTVNTALRAEIRERLLSEEALHRARADLVQAEKLSALGQMTAGISHELNQPLMAIQSYAENGKLLIARDKLPDASRNFAHVSDLAKRMARIIRNFRSFSRQESEPAKKVDLVSVIKMALDVSGSRLAQENVTLTWHPPAHPVYVHGGEVRLQQVVINLISNALDAMSESDRKSLSILIEAGSPVRLIVRDSGPGIEAPAKVFEPFYTTKAVGQGDGVGLGLSISYGLVQSFGGSIRGRNLDTGGAEFTVELLEWSEVAAA